ncbi:ABC-three component system middle component 1 [Sporanaerobacter sp. PP17-6a]|jgi:hypothetical protein|uniref:ABC-three component system middle component 1 n=1 Tax=Sporanaerobacter sp. PP17-6a TaxID=1891289 RepID=UPI0008A05419|nr:ABC-three component system middle component 1 [Sporanaerobacter sp. PP17-6a]SCL85428.1 hypothetical protein PP176A_0860 [Sporanaerobacter sp. PP17-6a]
MRLAQYLDIVSILNGGSVVFDDKENKSEIKLGLDNLRLYFANNKYYFISELKESLAEIEKEIFENEIVKTFSSRQPNNSYLILLYNVKSISNDVYKKVIKLEENEFFYKKYVLYYTDNEFTDFMNWWNQIDKKALLELLMDEDLDPNIPDNHIHFLFRLLIKTPFIHLEFPKAKMANFDDLLDKKLQRLTSDKFEVNEIYKYLLKSLEHFNSEEISDSLLKKIIEEGQDETKIHKL